LRVEEVARESFGDMRRKKSGDVVNPRMECPGCGEIGIRTLFHASDRLYKTTDKHFLVVECKNCRLIRLEPRPSLAELERYYPKEYWFTPDSGKTSQIEESYRRFVLRDHVNFVLHALGESRESGLVVDVGCGGGLFLRLLREHGLPVLGIETSYPAAQSAWKQNHVAVVCGDLSDSPIVRGSCAAVTMFHVLEHLHDPVSYLRSARDLLMPDGRLIVQVPNASSWQFLMFGEHWNGVDVPRHLVNYRQRDLENLLEYCGFEVLRRKHFSLRDNPAGFASSVAPGLDPMARRVRKVRETPVLKFVKDLVYFAILLASLPFTLFEAACGAGSTIMVEARKKA
jgi:2-polyprenyl-3-methyl-5-hydroxy-6-metoxy-1,4-benzoquinol methylase